MHKSEWIELHTHLMIPFGPKQNFVLVERDFSDLETKMNELLRRPKDAERIAAEGIKVFRDRYLTPAAQACYWRRLFTAWRGVMGFEVELWMDIEPRLNVTLGPPQPTEISQADKKGEVKKSGGRKMRGKPFETFILEE